MVWTYHLFLLMENLTEIYQNAIRFFIFYHNLMLGNAYNLHVCTTVKYSLSLIKWLQWKKIKLNCSLIFVLQFLCYRFFWSIWRGIFLPSSITPRFLLAGTFKKYHLILLCKTCVSYLTVCLIKRLDWVKWNWQKDQEI